MASETQQQTAATAGDAPPAAASSDDHPLRAMVCVDRSDHAMRAFEYYVKHVHRAENEVIVLHVSDQVKLPTYALFSEGVGFSPEEMRARVEELRRQNHALEDKFNKKCNEEKIKHKVLIISDDSEGHGAAIVESAKKHHVNLIVVGSRGHGALKRTIMGSTSTYIIHHSHIPTLVCPAPKHHHHQN